MSPIFILPPFLLLFLFPVQVQAKCDNSLCNHEAICTLKGETPTCSCVPKFFKGDSCSEMIDHCNPNPCRNKGTCRPYLGHYFCECLEGFSGRKCTSKKEIFTGLHVHYNHIAPVGKEQVFLLTLQSLGAVQTTMDFFTSDYVLDGGSFSSSTEHFKAHNRLSNLAKSLKLKHSEMMPYDRGYFRISRASFWKLGLQQLTLELSDEEDSESFFSETFNVMVYDPTGKMCLPELRLPNCENPRESLHIDIVSFNFIEPIVQKRCAERSDLKIKWSVRNYIDSVVLHKFPQDSSTTLTISPYTMWFDFRDDYLQSYLVQGTVRELSSGGKVVSSTVVRCYVFVDSKKTEANIIGGPSREVNVGRSFVIDGSPSRDYARRPGGNQKLNYKWSCTSDDSTNAFCSSSMGNGPKLFIPSNVLNIGSTYKYSLEVQSTINIYSSNVANQTIKPVDEDPLYLNFECLRNCAQLKFAAGKPVHLKVECLNCPPEEVAYSIRDEGGAEVSTSSRVILTERMRSEISLEATATLAERKGSVSVKLKVNKPPAGGKCAVSPTSGTAYQTIFDISCPGYVDSQPITFTYKAGSTILDHSRNKTLTTRLFPTNGGSCEVTVHVCDDLKACAEDRLQVVLSPISPDGSWLAFLQKAGSDLQQIILDSDRLAVHALVKAAIRQMPAGEALDVAEFVVKSLRAIQVKRLLATEQVLSMASQLFDAAPLTSKSAGLASELFAKVSQGLEHSVQNQEVAELDLKTHQQMLDELAQAMSRASAKVEEFPTVHTAEVMPPEDPLAEDYPDYGELDVQEVVNISNWLRAFEEMHRCLQNMGVVSAFLQLPGETPVLVRKKGLTTKTLVVDTSERISLSLRDMQTYVHLSPGFLETIGHREIAVQFSVFEANPVWWYPEQHKVRTEVLSLGAYWKDLDSMRSRSFRKDFSFTMTLKEAQPGGKANEVRGRVNGPLDMPVYKRQLPPNAVLTVRVLPPDAEVRVLLTVGKKPRSYMLRRARRVKPGSEEAQFTLVNRGNKPNEAFVALAAQAVVSFAFTMSVRTCLTWNPTVADWTSKFCTVGSKTNSTHIHCSCSHLSVFAAKDHSTFSLLQSSGPILKELSLNYSMMATYFLIVILLLVALFVAWRRDLAAVDGVLALNGLPRETSPYKYLVTMYTSGHARAATSSNPTIQLQGAFMNSPNFTLYSDPQRPVFERNSQASFILHCPTYLGALQSVALHHDSLGRSPFWNCHAVKVRDEIRDEEYMFLVNKRLSDHESTSCTVSATLLTRDDLGQKSLIFRDTLANDFANWYSLQVVNSQRLYEGLSGTEKTAVFVARVCVVLIGTMVVFGPTTILTYEEERETYYHMLLDFGKLFPIVFVCHLLGLIAGLGMRYFFIKLKTRSGERAYTLVTEE